MPYPVIAVLFGFVPYATYLLFIVARGAYERVRSVS